MAHVILTQDVKDYAQWKQGFDSGESDRSQKGIETLGVYTVTDNPNKVTVIAEFPSVEAVHGLMNDPQLKENMQNAGVLGAPDVRIVEKR